MANPVFPSYMDYTAATYSFGGPDGVMRTEVSGGTPRYALDYDRGLQQFSISMMLNRSQVSVWMAFFYHIIKKGSITFDMNLDSGFGQQVHACNIIPGSYSATRTGGEWTVITFVVEAESKVYDMTAAEAQSLIDVYNLYGQDTDDLLARLAQFALVDSLVLADA